MMGRMPVQIDMEYNPRWLEQILRLYEEAGLGKRDPKKLGPALQNSYRVATAWDDARLCGIGRIVSDAVYYASIFEVGVLPEYRRRGVGRAIMAHLENALPNACLYLTSTFGHEGFYQKLGYRKHLTAMAKYPPRMGSSPYLAPAE